MIAAALILAAGLAAPLAGAEDAASFVLITRDLQTRSIELVEIDGTTLVHLTDERWEPVPLDDCLGLVRADARPQFISPGAVVLADGQRLPGLASGEAVTDHIGWAHSLLGSLVVPLERVLSVVFGGGDTVPAGGEADTVVLRNGEVLDGLVVGLGEQLEIELDGPDGPRIVDVPASRVLAVGLVTPPEPAAGRRIWLRDTSILAIDDLEVAEGSTLRARAPVTGMDPVSVPLQSVTGIQLAPGAMQPLAALVPARIEGPDTRFVLPRPVAIDRYAPLGLATLRVHGPLVVHYTLPPGAAVRPATARLSPGMERWGDFELVVRVDGREAFRTTINGRHREADFNVALDGSELTIEITEGANGPIQDAVDLVCAMIAID